MACYKRIYYIDYYENGEKHANVGFLKLFQKKYGDCVEGTCLQINVSERPVKDKVYGKVRVMCGAENINLGQVEMIAGRGTAQILNLDGTLDELAKEVRESVLLRVELADGRYYECELKPAENKIVGDAVLEMTEVMKEEEIPVEMDEMPAKVEPSLDTKDQMCSMAEVMSEMMAVKRDKWQQLWNMIPHIRPFEDEREYLRIELRDMVILPKMYYRLTENSFLRHGYYNYGHLILTKIYKRGQEKICVGVPGNYYEKEKQIAVLFGFESFEPKTEPAKEGDFGYYMIGVDI